MLRRQYTPEKGPAYICLNNGRTYGRVALGQGMESFEVKRGLIKALGGNAGLAKLAAEQFDNVEVNTEGIFTGSFTIMTKVEGQFTDDGKLLVDVEQMKGDDLDSFLSADGGREKAMEARKRWSSFLDQATGYNAKQRGDKAKEGAKKIAKSKSAISMARKFMEVSDTVTDENREKAEALIAEIEEKLAEKNSTRAFSLSEKLNKLFG